MGHHIAILRTSSDGEQPISFEEAARAASAIEGWQVSSEEEEFILPLHDQDHLTLWLEEGRLWTKNPTEAGIAATLVLAKRLGARVRGDEFETYRAVDESYIHPDDAAEIAAATREGAALVRKAKRKSIVFHACIIVCFLGLALLARSCDHQAKLQTTALTTSRSACQHPNNALLPGLTGCSTGRQPAPRAAAC